jgi:hypothetical protein
VSLASLPHTIPFKLGGLLRPNTVKATGFTGIIPSGLPFNLSSGHLYDDIEYGTVGWELICRSYKDFQTEILRTKDVNTLTFSKELSALGAASFSLNLDHSLLTQTLNNGSVADTLFDYENLWEIRFDGQIVFQMLGTAVTDSQINEAESRTATVNGSGTGKVLSWAQIFPTGFPDNIVTKLDTLKDEFSGDEIDRAIWTHTSISPTIAYTNAGGREEEQVIIDNLLQEKEGLQADFDNAEEDLTQAEADYKAVMKDPGSTTAEKQAALKEVAAARTKQIAAAQAINVNQQTLNAAIARRNFYAPSLVDESPGHLRIRLNSAGTFYATTKTYDIKNSGVTAGVDPAPTSFAQAGNASTVFKLMHDPGDFEDYYVDPRNYAKFYTQKTGGQHRLVAEVASDGEVVNNNWQWDSTSQRYWRIREDSGYLIFDTSPNATTWTERFRALYSWPSDEAVFQFGVEYSGDAGIAPPLSAYLYHLNSSGLPATQTTMQIFLDYLEASQARGVIPFVQADFTGTHDSGGRAWEGKLDIVVPEGTNLVDALTNLAGIQQVDWIMEPDFTLKAYQKIKTDEAIPPVYFLKDDVVFHEAGSQINKERSRNRDGIANAIVGKNSVGQYAYIEDEDSIDKYQRREAFISAGNATSLTDLASILDSSLEELKEEKTSWKVSVSASQAGRRVFKDYNVGDWISIENVDSRNNVSVGQWRVVGIAINVAADATQTVELTLQSRRELLIERLKQQVANLSPSSGSSTITIGSAINAATLIEQATLAGLRDVAITNPVEGDVLTYSKGYWVPIAPGDKTVPKTPNFLSAYTNVYYPSDGITVRGQVELTWDLPFNTDGSFISDGHHFEIRYQPDNTADYGATWFEAGQFDWQDTFTWGQPTIPPIVNSGWQTLYVGWDELSTVIQELTPGIDYVFQIRAVDSSTPQHFSEWSDNYEVSVAVDSIAPDKPAPPVVASSYLAIQVSHYLGKSTGGTFNLPPDMAYLEVHAGTGAFYPDESSRIGKIIADAGLIRSGTPVIQSFNIDSTENIYVRVIAVDQTGNRSAPSDAATATINLIDDAHISDLTASKITAGTISSSIILGGVIKTAETGARAEMNFEGFRIYSEDEDPTVSLLGNPSSNGNFLLIKDLEDPTATLAGIDGLGRGSFQDVSVTNDITIQGEKLIADIITPRSKGVIAIGTYASPVVGAGTGVERGFLEISFIAEESRTYMICAVTEFESTSVGNERLIMRLRDGGSSAPTLALPWLQQSISMVASSSAGANGAAQIIYAGTFTPGLHRILWSFTGQLGNATVNATGGSGVESTTIIWVEDVGMPQTDTVILNDAGIDALSAPTTPDTRPPTPTPKITYTRNYSATWSGTYRSNGDFSDSHGSTMVQGDSGADSWLNDARSLCGFNWQQIMADTKDSTIKECYITLYANHWYWNDGGTARIGTHNYTGRPSSWSGSRVVEQRINSNDWPKPGKRKVSLGTTIGNEFKSGASKGVALGPTNGTKTQYGKFNGNGQSNEPVLTIVYVK